MIFNLHYRDDYGGKFPPAPTSPFKSLKAAKRWAKDHGVPKYVLSVVQWNYDTRNAYGCPELIGEMSLDQVGRVKCLSEIY